MFWSEAISISVKTVGIKHRAQSSTSEILGLVVLVEGVIDIPRLEKRVRNEAPDAFDGIGHPPTHLCT